MISRKKLKLCKTVGALIKELEKLPTTARLSNPMRPVHCNTGATAKELGLKPEVDFMEEWI